MEARMLEKGQGWGRSCRRIVERESKGGGEIVGGKSLSKDKIEQ